MREGKYFSRQSPYQPPHAAPMKLQDYPHLSKEQLVGLCLSGDREAWNEFFRRYDRIIERAILGTLIKANQFKLINNYDLICEIKEPVVVMLYNDRGLERCSKPEFLEAWLRRVAINKTLDWLIHRGRIRSIPERFVQETLHSLDEPFGQESGATLGDTIRDKDQPEERASRRELEAYIEKLFGAMDRIDGERAYWALKLSILAYAPLDADEKEALSRFNRMSVREIDEHLEKMYRFIDKKMEKKHECESKAIVLWYRIMRTQSRLHESGAAGDDGSGLLEKEISDYTHQRNDSLLQSRILARPSNRDIGMLIGLPEEQVNQVTNILIRAREALMRLGSAGAEE